MPQHHGLWTVSHKSVISNIAQDGRLKKHGRSRGEFMFCAGCGKQAHETDRYCSFCANPLDVPTTASVSNNPLLAKPTPAPEGFQKPTEYREITFYSDDSCIRVTDTRLMVRNTTYAMSNITSVSVQQTDPSYWGVGLSIGIGCVLLLLAVGTSSWLWGIVGVLILGGAIYGATTLKPDYHLRVSSASGESSAYSSKDKGHVEKLVQSINEAIIHRG